MSEIVVDCHSHVFNAEDIPIDGFLKRKLRAPALLTGVFSVPLDLVAAGRAPGSVEAAKLLSLIKARLDGTPADGGLESVGDDEPEEVLSDDELDARLVQYLAVERPVPPDGQPDDSGLESIGDPEVVLADLIASGSPRAARRARRVARWVECARGGGRRGSSTTSAPRPGPCAWLPSGSATPCG